jgi:hypothetical protein
MSLKSKCCGAKVKVVMSGDFIGDNPNTQGIGTCHYECLKCKEACNVIYTERRTWTRKPQTQIIPNKKKNKLSKAEIKKFLKEEDF